MSKRILLISYYFAPQNTIGAIRPTKMAKYLERMGYEVTVICGGGLDDKQDPTLQRDLKSLKDVHILREWNPLRDHAAKKAAQTGGATARAAVKPLPDTEEMGASISAKLVSLLKRVVGKVIDKVYLYLAWVSDRHFGHLAKREIRSLEGIYDCVFSSYSTFSVHEAARYAQKTGKAGKWIADFRDEVNLFFWWQNGRARRYTDMVRRHADLITAVSYGVLDMMDMEETGRVLTNGFDREDLPAAACGESRQDGKLRVAYCGYISEGRKNAPHRDLSPMMQTLRALIDEGVLEKEQLLLVYAGSQGALFEAVAAASGLESCVENHGMVSRQESIRLQLTADLLLMASWHMTGRKGILTGKLFEYMMMEKPVICCMSGDLTGSDVKGVLENTGIGFCYEQAGGEADKAALKDFVAEMIRRHHQQLPLLDSARGEALNTFAYPELAGKLASWIEEQIS